MSPQADSKPCTHCTQYTLHTLPTWRRPPFGNGSRANVHSQSTTPRYCVLSLPTTASFYVSLLPSYCSLLLLITATRCCLRRQSSADRAVRTCRRIGGRRAPGCSVRTRRSVQQYICADQRQSHHSGEGSAGGPKRMSPAAGVSSE